jgi:hypothetical protein
MLVIGADGVIFQFHSLNSLFSLKRRQYRGCPASLAFKMLALGRGGHPLKSIDPDEPHFHAAIGAGGMEYAAHAEKMEYANGDLASFPMLAKGRE